MLNNNNQSQKYQQSYKYYIDFKDAIAKAIAQCRQPYTQQTMPAELKKIIDKAEGFLNGTTRSTVIWTQLSETLKPYAWYQFYIGQQSTFLSSIDRLLKQFTIISLMQKDILELENVNIQLEQRCEALEKSNKTLREDFTNANDPELAERYKKLEQENNLLKMQNYSLIEHNESLLLRLQQLEQYNEQLTNRLEQLAEANQLLQKAHEGLQTQHEHVIEQIKQSDEFKADILSELKLIKEQQIKQESEIEALRQSGIEKDKRIEALTQQGYDANKASYSSIRYRTYSKNSTQAPPAGNSKTPIYQLSTTLGCEIHQPRYSINY